MTVKEIDTLFGKYREGPLTPSDFKEIMSGVLGQKIEMPQYMSRIMTTSDYKIMIAALDTLGLLGPGQADAIQLPKKFHGNLNVSDLKQQVIKLASDYSPAP
jgi:hypothetical protein